MVRNLWLQYRNVLNAYLVVTFSFFMLLYLTFTNVSLIIYQLNSLTQPFCHQHCYVDVIQLMV